MTMAITTILIFIGYFEEYPAWPPAREFRQFFLDFDLALKSTSRK